MNEQYPPLGFGPLPLPIRVFIGQEQGETSTWGWYTLDAGDRRIVIPHPSLTGYVRELRLVPKSSERHGDSLKLDIVIEADKPYVVRSGIETMFSRDLALALTIVDSLDKPITIAAVPGSESKTVFCHVYQHGSRVFPERNDRAEVEPLIVAIAKRLGQASVYANNNGNGNGRPPAASEARPSGRNAVSAGLATPATVTINAPRTTSERMSVAAQHAELQRLAGTRGWTRDYLDAESQTRYGWPHDQLTFTEALTFTGELKKTQ